MEEFYTAALCMFSGACLAMLLIYAKDKYLKRKDWDDLEGHDNDTLTQRYED